MAKYVKIPINPDTRLSVLPFDDMRRSVADHGSKVLELRVYRDHVCVLWAVTKGGYTYLVNHLENPPATRSVVMDSHKAEPDEAARCYRLTLRLQSLVA